MTTTHFNSIEVNSPVSARVLRIALRWLVMAALIFYWMVFVYGLFYGRPVLYV